MTRFFLFLLLWSIALGGWSQPVRDVKAEVLGDSVRISYRLEDPNPERLFRVRLAVIRDQDTLPLTQVRGDLSDSLRAGSYAIMWNARAEWTRYRGPVRFVVQAVPGFTILAPAKPISLKRTKPFTFKWAGGNSTLDTLRLELYQYDKRISPVAVVGQKGQYTWQVPAGLKTGEGYRLKLTGTALSGLDAFTPEFAVVRKVPLYAIIIPPVAVVGGLVSFLLLRRRPLPGPPGDPGNSDAPVYLTTYPVPK